MAIDSVRSVEQASENLHNHMKIDDYTPALVAGILLFTDPSV